MSLIAFAISGVLPASICRASAREAVPSVRAQLGDRNAVPWPVRESAILQLIAAANQADARHSTRFLADSTSTSPDSLAGGEHPPLAPPIPEMASAASMAPSLTLESLLRRDYTDRVLLRLGSSTDSGSTNEASAWQALALRLRQAEYDDISVYPLDSAGFAVVCPVEHIDKSGKRKHPEWGWTFSKRGWWDWVRSIAVPQTEFYRVVLLIAPSAPAAADSTLPDPEYADRLASGGTLNPPSANARRALPDGQCEVRVYEFFRKNENAAPEFVKVPNTRARDHARKSRLWSKEELR